MNINKATTSFEMWLGEQLAAHGGMDAPAVTLKHQAMKQEGAHAFLRATFYRWVQRWQTDGIPGPKVLSVGDTHVENFGTWRDLEGRLVWGVNDFDEVCELPYTSDLIRLAVSARFAIKELDDFHTSAIEAGDLILRGYTQAFDETTSLPLVLFERNSTLTRLVLQTFLATPAEKFWKKRFKKTQPADAVPVAAQKLLEFSLPAGSDDIEFRKPVPDDPPGLGSRGKPRFYAFAMWQRERVLREIKPVVPSAWSWANETSGGPSLEKLLNSPHRCPDPTQQVRDGWIVRRLAQDAIKIELSDLASDRATRVEEEELFESMGVELGRLHAGSNQRTAIVKDLSQRLAQNKDWFTRAVKKWAEIVEEDQRTFALPES